MTEASKELVEKLRYLQKEIAELQAANREQDAEILRLKSGMVKENAHLRENNEKLITVRARLDSAEENQRRQLIEAKTGRREWFREDPKEPEYRVVVSKQGEVYKV